MERTAGEYRAPTTRRRTMTRGGTGWTRTMASAFAKLGPPSRGARAARRTDCGRSASRLGAAYGRSRRRAQVALRRAASGCCGCCGGALPSRDRHRAQLPRRPRRSRLIVLRSSAAALLLREARAYCALHAHAGLRLRARRARALLASPAARARAYVAGRGSGGATADGCAALRPPVAPHGARGGNAKLAQLRGTRAAAARPEQSWRHAPAARALRRWRALCKRRPLRTCAAATSRRPLVGPWRRGGAGHVRSRDRSAVAARARAAPAQGGTTPRGAARSRSRPELALARRGCWIRLSGGRGVDRPPLARTRAQAATETWKEAIGAGVSDPWRLPGRWTRWRSRCAARARSRCHVALGARASIAAAP